MRPKQARREALRLHGNNPSLQTPRRLATDVAITDGGYFRVHVHPKRFPAAYGVDWRSRIVHDCADYVVVNKPAGVQVHTLGICRLCRFWAS